jgi:hypothetical protein
VDKLRVLVEQAMLMSMQVEQRECPIETHQARAQPFVDLVCSVVQRCAEIAESYACMNGYSDDLSEEICDGTKDTILRAYIAADTTKASGGQ